jgi:acyl-CoA thioesterase
MIAPSTGRMWDSDLASRSLGMELLEAYEGRATVTMTISDTMINGYGMAHGGYVFLLADSAFGCACNTYGPATVASGGEIDFVRPVRAGDKLVAVATERARYGRSGIYDVTISRGGEVVAEMRGRSRMFGEGQGS